MAPAGRFHIRTQSVTQTGRRPNKKWRERLPRAYPILLRSIILSARTLGSADCISVDFAMGENPYADSPGVHFATVHGVKRRSQKTKRGLLARDLVDRDHCAK